MTNSFGARTTLTVGAQEYEIYRLDPCYLTIQTYGSKTHL